MRWLVLIRLSAEWDIEIGSKCSNYIIILFRLVGKEMGGNERKCVFYVFRGLLQDIIYDVHLPLWFVRGHDGQQPPNQFVNRS